MVTNLQLWSFHENQTSSNHRVQDTHNYTHSHEILSICVYICVCIQATELAELTSKISLLEDAKKKKDEEASEWQMKVNMDTC